MSTLLRDVITIPERAGAEDYVLRLSDSVGHGAAARTLDAYVVTTSIVEAFDAALGLTAAAITDHQSRGAYLDGSFGSGKSHFMAVLHALLRQEAAARGKAELQPVVARHDPVLRDKKILPLAFHLLGATTLEQALVDGYLRQVTALHPGAPLPAVHKSDRLLEDAERLRRRMGDDAFFASLNGEPGSLADTAADPWAAVLGAGTWDASSYTAACAAAPDSDLRRRLVTVLVERHFTSYTQQAEYLDLDAVLAAISAHAKDLGYDAVVMFLDELVLWLSFMVQDAARFGQEAGKLTKLVESSVGHRPVPIVSFISRQKGLLAGFSASGATGAHQAALDKAFAHQSGRFLEIPLGDENLPFVAHERLLRPKSPAAAAELNAAFEAIERRSAVWDVLLDGVNTDERHRGSDAEAFRLTYPFSPALVSTLRALAGAMQRERTALKVMQQMLVDRRNTLTIDDVIPVGDSFDLVVRGQSGHALDAQTATLFRSADRLYTEKLRPLLLRMNDLTENDLDSAAPPKRFATDDRLAKTLLLSAVAPNVPALKAMTASRLASLNHGSVVSPIPGNEATVVLAKVRAWANEVPEIRLEGDDRNPTIRVQLADVDYESIVDRAKGEDNAGRRTEMLKRLVGESLDLDLGATDMQGAHRQSIVWRGSRRDVDVLFGNVRDRSWLSDDHFLAAPGTWRFVIDHPFDDAGHSAAEDLQRLDAMLAANLESRTVVWLPRFLSDERLRDLRRLVILSWLLEGSGDRWQSHADHLNEADRALAKSILESQRSSLQHTLTTAIQQAYGAAAPAPGNLLDDGAHDRVLVSLDRAFSPARPNGATMRIAFENLVDQALATTHPQHPTFEPGDVEVRVKDLRAVAAHVSRAAADRERRVELQGDVAAVRRIATKLGVGTAAETHFILGDDRFTPWGREIESALGRRAQGGGKAPGDPVTVAELRTWIDEVKPSFGLRPEAADLVIITWAALRQRAWFHHGQAMDGSPEVGTLSGQMELREQPMPSPADWSAAVATAAALFGVNASAHLTAPAVADFVRKVTEQATETYGPAGELVGAVEHALAQIDGDGATRLRTARAVHRLVGRLRHLTGVPLVEALARPELPGTPEAAGRSLARAKATTDAIRRFGWDRLAPLKTAANTEGERAAEARVILSTLRDAVSADELVTPVEPALVRADRDLFDWLARGQTPTPVPTPEPTDPHDDDAVTVHDRAAASRPAGATDDDVLARLRSFLEKHRDHDVEVTWRVLG